MPITEINDNLIFVYVVVGSVIERDGKFLLVQEKKPSVHGLWNLPAGKAERDCNLEKNAIREVKEETGFDAKIIREIDVVHNEGDKSVKHVYKAEIVGGEINIPEDEIMDVRWFTFDEIRDLMDQGKIRQPWVFEAIKSQAER